MRFEFRLLSAVVFIIGGFELLAFSRFSSRDQIFFSGFSAMTFLTRSAKTFCRLTAMFGTITAIITVVAIVCMISFVRSVENPLRSVRVSFIFGSGLLSGFDWPETPKRVFFWTRLH